MEQYPPTVTACCTIPAGRSKGPQQWFEPTHIWVPSWKQHSNIPTPPLPSGVTPASGSSPQWRGRHLNGSWKDGGVANLFPPLSFFLLAPIRSTRQVHRSSRRHATHLACNASSHAPTDWRGVPSLSTTPSSSKITCRLNRAARARTRPTSTLLRCPKPTRPGLGYELCAMLNEAGPLFLRPFLLTRNLSGFLPDDVPGALQTLAPAGGPGCLTAHVAPDAFFTAPAKAALDGSQHPSSTLRLSVSIGTLSV